MEQGSYLKWLYYSLTDVQCSLLASLEQKDYIQYIEAPEIQNKYMNTIGNIEQDVLRVELEVAILEKKKQRIQIALNRNEKIDLTQLEKELNQEKVNLLQQLNDTYAANSVNENPNVSSEELEQIKKLYKEIVENFHPETHTLTANQKVLYDKAMEYFRNRKLAELEIVHEMLMSTKGIESLEIGLNISLTEGPSGVTDKEVLEFVDEIGTNYTLAGELYDCFEKTEEELVLYNTKLRYEARQEAVLKEIEVLYNNFPLNAKETIQDETKLNEYLQVLTFRKQTANEKINALTKEIDEMIKELPL